ncbi:hypothetical protein [Aliidiomarina haloalkalitolerans]|uniref:Uncharacterized protein n=1 Tax=Aliidiomarina haloalkalitolerans TaxID=859059 RepID=A0A432VXU7_9GAMM|nr:hypothetical protein [Aliidiomarina haloalkalitolerans]RUO21499.1 hypothetical protein CWE06_01170 [Aliidiomarina haloalkalitolerans]
MNQQSNQQNERNATDQSDSATTNSSSDLQAQREAAVAALNLVKEKKKSIVKHLHLPWWQDPVIGLLMAMLVIHHAAPMPYDIIIVAVGCIGMVLVLRHYTNQALWVSGWRRGKTRKLSYAFFVIYLIHLFGSMWLNSQGHQWIIPVSAVSIFVIAQIYGRVWMSTWRKEMEAEDVG